MLDRLENTPAYKLADPNVVFDKLEGVKRSPMRVQLVCKDLMKEAEEMDKENEENASPKKAAVTREEPAEMTSTRLTRSTRKKITTKPLPKSELMLSFVHRET